MAKLININTNEEKEVKEDDNEDLKIKAEEMGVLFACEDGRCGSCNVEITEGKENLSERTENEKELGVQDPHRLICQCKLQGDIKFKP